MKALGDAVLPGFSWIDVLFDHPLFCEPFAQVVGDEFRAVVAAQDRRNAVGFECSWDGPVLWTKLIRVPFQGECTAVVAAWVVV